VVSYTPGRYIPGEMPSILNKLDADWHPKPIGTLWRRKKLYPYLVSNDYFLIVQTVAEFNEKYS
jgi:hypothetical protein